MRALLLRDLKIALRAGGGFGHGVAFFLIVCTLVPFGVGPDTAVLGRIAPGILWLGALLACLLSLDRVFSRDFDDGTLDALATAPLPMEAVVLAKAGAHWITSALPLVVVAPVLGVLLNLAPATLPIMVFSLLIGTPALSMIGAFGAALTLGHRRGGLLLSLLVLPLYMPTLIFGAVAVARFGSTASVTTAILLLAGLTLACWAILPFAAAAAIRVNLR